MAIAFACGQCGKTFEAGDEFAGRRSQCPGCGTTVIIPGAAPPPPPPPPPPARRPVSPAATTATPPKGARPLPAAPVPPPADTPTKKAAGKFPLLLGLGGLGLAAVLAVGCGLGGWFFFFRSKEPAVAQTTHPEDTKPVPTETKGTPTDTRPKKPSDGPLTGDQVFRRLLPSTVLVISPPSSIGSGVLVHAEQRIFVTNYHVVRENAQVLVFFVDRDVEHKPIPDLRHYLNNRERLAIKGTVLDRDPTLDVAVVQLERLPEDARAVSLAAQSAEPGQSAFSIGASGVNDNALWRYTDGKVRGVTKRKLPPYSPTQQVDAWILETQSASNHGDSGGPMVNDRMRLIGIVTGGDPKKEQAVDWNIDVREVRAMLERCFSNVLKQKWEDTEPDPYDDPAGTPAGPEETKRSPREWAELLRDPDERQARLASARLVQAGAAAIPEVRPLLKDGSRVVRVRAVQVLGRLGETAAEAVADLAGTLSDTDDGVRQAAADALGKLGPTARQALPALLRAAGDSNPKVRTAADGSLRRLGPFVKEDAPALAAALKDGLPPTRLYAAGVLVLLNLEVDVLVPILKPALQDADKEVRTLAVLGLGNLGRLARETVFPVLMPMLRDADREVRGATIIALSKLGTPTLGDLKAIRATLTERRPEVREFAANMLRDLGPEAAAAVGDLITALQDPERIVRAAAAEAIGRLGKTAKVALPELLKARLDSDPGVRRHAVEALAAVGREAGVVDALLGSVEDEPEVAAAAVASLDKLLPPLGKEDTEALARALGAKRPAARLYAASVLARIGADARPALPALLVALKDTEPGVRFYAAVAVGNIGPDAKAAAPVLAELVAGKAEPGSTPMTPTLVAASGERVYQRALRSTAWVVTTSPYGAVQGWGSGWLASGTQKLLVTNYHVVTTHGSVMVFFPSYEGDKPVTEPQFYLKNSARLGVRGVVVARDPTNDLAVIQLPTLPPGAAPLPLAAQPPGPGQTVHSIGASGVDPRGLQGTLWRYTKGEVRQVYAKQLAFRTGQRIDTTVVETSAPINPGDSGGPVVNDKGELVAVVSSYTTGDRLVSANIDGRRVRGLLEGFLAQSGRKWASEGNTVATLPMLLGGDLRRQAAKSLSQMGPAAAEAVPVLKKVLVESKEADVQLYLIETLGALGPASKAAVPNLVEQFLVSPQHFEKAAEALGKIGKGAVPYLEEQLTDRKVLVRHGAVVALGLIGPDAKSAVLKLGMRVSKDASQVVRDAARTAIKRIQSPKEKE